MLAGTSVTRFGTAALALLLLGAVPACGTSGPPVAAPSTAPGAAICPETVYDAAVPSFDSRGGDLVPLGATQALMCVYPMVLPTSTGPTGPTVSVARDPAQVASYLNGLPSVDPAANRRCTLVGYGVHQIVLGYPTGTHVTVEMDRNCGTVSSTGATGYVDQWRTLLGFWPDVS